MTLVGKKGDALEETCGYYGERIALEAQRLGLNTCWVAASYSKGKAAAAVHPGEKLLMLLTIGYGETGGVPHKGKPMEEFRQCNGQIPDWFRRGVETVSLAPTAMNQQKFRFTLRGNVVSATAGSGFYAKTDLGIAKYHFKVGAGEGGWKWA